MTLTLLAAVASLALLGGQNQQSNYYPTTLHEQLVCAPAMLPAAPLSGIRVIGNSDRNRTLFATGDAVILDAGGVQGIKLGQRFFVRRIVHDEFIGIKPADLRPVSIHTAGWVTVVDVRDHVAVAQVTQACDGIIAGDYLEPYVDPVEPPAGVDGEPDYDHAGRIVMGDERRQMGAAGTLMVVDRGSDGAVRPGETVTIYRETMGGIGPVYQIARGTVVSVRAQSALVRIDASREAVYIGDRVAINRMTK
jgi:hypothetical protein